LTYGSIWTYPLLYSRKDVAMNDDLAKKLRSLYRIDETARSFFDWAAQRLKNATETSLETIENRAGIGHIQSVALGRTLSEMGVCEFITGRKGYKTRLKWMFNLRRIGLVARGEENVISTPEDDWGTSFLDDVDDEVLISDSPNDLDLRPLTIPEAKRRLALSLDVDPSLIEITVKA